MMLVQEYHYSRCWVVYWSGQSLLVCPLSSFGAVRRQATEETERERNNTEKTALWRVKGWREEEKGRKGRGAE